MCQSVCSFCSLMKACGHLTYVCSIYRLSRPSEPNLVLRRLAYIITKYHGSNQVFSVANQIITLCPKIYIIYRKIFRAVLDIRAQAPEIVQNHPPSPSPPHWGDRQFFNQKWNRNSFHFETKINKIYSRYFFFLISPVKPLSILIICFLVKTLSHASLPW